MWRLWKNETLAVLQLWVTYHSLQVAQVTGGRGACSEVSVRELWPRGCGAAGPGASGPGWETPGSGSRLLPLLPSCPCTEPAPPWSSSAASPARNLHKPFWKWGNFKSFHHKRSECRNNCFSLPTTSSSTTFNPRGAIFLTFLYSHFSALVTKKKNQVLLSLAYFLQAVIQLQPYYLIHIPRKYSSHTDTQVSNVSYSLATYKPLV